MTDQKFIEQGYAALQQANWVQAQEDFEAALAERSSPEAHDGLGVALWWQNRVGASHYHRTQAFLGYQHAQNLRRAAWLAAWLAREQVFFRGNASAMHGWFARAERLIGTLEPCAAHGWVALYQASMNATPADLVIIAQHAMALAHADPDPDLAALALANAGLGAIANGQLTQGQAWIDEAMTMATSSEVRDHFVVCEIFCVTLSACELAGDWVRTDHWCAQARRYAEQYHCPFLSAYCRTTYGGILIATGRWQDAEQALTEAIALFDSGHQALRVHAVLKLADLRVGQGRLEEAEVLLTGYEDYGSAVLPRARLHLARQEPALAKAVLEQAIQSLPAQSLYRAPLQRLLIDCYLALGEQDHALQAQHDLWQQAQRTQNQLLFAEAYLALGQIARSTHDPQAGEYFTKALEYLQTLEQSVVAGRTRLELARTLQDTDPIGAITWARAALACFTRLGATHDATIARQLLRSFGVNTNTAPTDQPGSTLTNREREVLTLLTHGLTNREIATRLVISEKTCEHHVRQILSKLGLRSRTEAAAYAIRLGDREDKGAK
ncbi:MAG: hypothetical protein OHK0050_41880 [Roseiflexaceae bacterium]